MIGCQETVKKTLNGFYRINTSRPTMTVTSAPATIVPIKHAARNYTGTQYALPTDEVERERLSFQHNIVLKRLFGNRILFAPVDLRPNDKILDVGTGPGLWATEMAETNDSSIEIFAVDISSRLFPTETPPNVHFMIESVTNLPKAWDNTFALVHQRLLLFALQESQWRQALSEIFRVLQPGGWVQLGENAAWIEGEYPEKPCMEKVVAMYRRLAQSRNLYIDCAKHIPSMLEDAGFVDIHIEEGLPRMGKWAGDDGIVYRDNHVGVFQGMKTPILEKGGFGYVRSEAEYDALIAGMEREWDEIPGTTKEYFVFWARKPLAQE
ncbi:S-adenosyl-L-methionine-dependent methyltransferase [Mycena floridula]|nr:S-adenosyl-L-methionine-dependent methyltransferase [Mycena floridula]